MHGESVGFAVTPSVALANAVVAAFLYACARMSIEASAATPAPSHAVPAE